MNPKKNNNHHEEKKDVFDAKNSFQKVYDEKTLVYNQCQSHLKKHKKTSKISENK